MAGTKLSAVDEHPLRADIIAMLSQGMMPRAIAQKINPPIKFTALEYYRRKVIPYLNARTKSTSIGDMGQPPASVTLNDFSERKIEFVLDSTLEAMKRGDNVSIEKHRIRLLERLEAMRVRRNRWLLAAEADRHWTACAQLDGADMRSVELEGRLLGLDAAPAANANSLVISFTSNNLQVSHNPAAQLTDGTMQTIDIAPDE